MAINKSDKSSNKNPQTMEDLLSSTAYKFQGLKKGQTVIGTITQLTPKSMLVDIGFKTEGMVAEREFEAVRDFFKTLKLGDKMSFQVVNPESESGQILLSLRKTASSQGWQKLQEAKEKKQELSVIVSQVSRNGLLVEAFGLTGFIPYSQIGSSLQSTLNDLTGKKITVRVVELDEAGEKLVFSEKAVSEKEKILETQKAIKKVKIGEEFQGAVSGITPFGIFVQISVDKTPVEGLVHISEISWEKVDDPNTFLKVGDEVTVKVIGSDEEAGRLGLSLKQTTADPWLNLVTKYPVETHISGKVAKLTSFGAFVEIEPNLTGLIHISKIPAEKKIHVGDEVTCFVEGIEPDKRRLSLGLALKEKPVGYK